MAFGVMTGVTMLVGVAEPSQAGMMTVEQDFYCSAGKEVYGASVDDGTDNFSNYPSFTSNTCGAFSVAQFNTLGGTLALTQVDFAVTGNDASEGSRLLTFLAGTILEPSEPFDPVTFEATASPTMSFSVPGIGTLSPATYTPSGSDSCTANDVDNQCDNNSGNPQTDLNPVFNGSSTNPGILALFQTNGMGTFDATATISALTGMFGLAALTPCPQTATECSMDARAYVEWDGLLTVSYTYENLRQVPVPGTLPLAGIGLLGLGSMLRKRKVR